MHFPKHFNLKKILLHSLAKGAIALTFANFLGGSFNYLFNILVGRALGPEGLGEIAATFSYVSVLSLPLGIVSLFILVQIGKQKDTKAYAGALHEWYLFLIKKFWWTSVIAVLIIPFIPKLTGLSNETAYFLVPLVIVGFIAGYYESLFQGLHMLVTLSVISIIGVFVKLLGGVSVYFFIKELWLILSFVLGSYILKIVIGHTVIGKHLANVSVMKINIKKKIKTIYRNRQLWLTGSSTIALTLLGNIDIIIAKRVFNAEDVGFYSAWLLFGKIILYIFGPILSIAFIFFSSRKYKKFHRPGFIFTIFIFALIGIVAYFGYDMFALTAVNLVFGHKFLPIAPYLDVAAIYGTCYLLVFFTHQFFLAKGSWGVLILPIFSVIYIGVILFAAKSIVILMMITVGFLALVFGSSLIFYLLRKNVIFSE